MTGKLFTALLGLILPTVFFAQVGFSQPSEELATLRKEIETLKASQLTIQKQLLAIQNLVWGGAVPRPMELQDIVVSIDGEPVKGDENAALTLIEFSDYQCPFCSLHFRKNLPKIEKNYIKTGKVKLVFRDFPSEAMHKHAFKAAEAAHCAGEQGKYWEMHDRLYANQKSLAPEKLPGHAQTLGLEVPKFRQCLDSGRHAAGIRKDMVEGRKAGVRGTPTFFIGLTDPDGSKVRTTRRIKGARPYSDFKQALDSLLTDSLLTSKK